MSLNSELENLELDLTELTSLVSTAKREAVIKLLSAEANRLTARKQTLQKALDSSDTTAANQALGSTLVHNYMWDQTSDFVKIYIDIEKNYQIDSSSVKLNFANAKSFSVVFGKYKFAISRLNAEVDVEKSYHKLTKTGKLIIYLRKKSSSNWPNINEVENRYKKLVDEEKELNDDQSDPSDPSAGLMKLMKQMYDEGDDDMKRTIAKSWYESRNKSGEDTRFDALS